MDQFYRTIDWDLLGFFGALFIVINVMEHAQVPALIGIGLEWIIALGPTVGTGAVMVATSVFSAVTDTITLIGSASTLVVVTIIHKQGLKFSFMDFVKKVTPFAAAQIVIATVYVLWLLWSVCRPRCPSRHEGQRENSHLVTKSNGAPND